MSYLPAPYESAQQDDLAAALGAGLAVSLAGITSWILGHWSYLGGRTLIDLGAFKGNTDLPVQIVVLTAGWAAGTVLMVLGGLVLLFRRGRGLLLFGALVAAVTTAIAQFKFELGTSIHQVAQWPLYWGGAAVLIVALLPATGRWVRRRSGQPTAPTSGYQGAATLWPGT